MVQVGVIYISILKFLLGISSCRRKFQALDTEILICYTDHDVPFQDSHP